MAYINIENVSFAYPNGFIAVDNLSMQIEKGSSVAIIGQNGAGKTTTVKLFNGLHHPTSGNVWIGDMNTKEYTTAQMSKKVGYVFQNPDDQIFHASVYDEVAFGPKMLKIPKEKMDTLIEYALEITGLSLCKEENPYNLPLSIRKFVTIAAIIAMDTEVMIFDEPTAGQDEVGNLRLSKILQILQNKGKTIITITHDMEFVSENFTEIIVMANKKIVTTGSPEVVFWDFPALKSAMLKQPSISSVCGKLSLGTNIIHIKTAVEAFMEEIACQHHIIQQK